MAATGDIEAALAEVRSHLRTGAHGVARQRLRKLIAQVPAAFEPHWLLAASLAQTGAMGAAVAELQVCAPLSQGDSGRLASVADALVAAGGTGEAERILREASRRDPAAVAVACRLARLLLASGRAAEALPILDRAAPDADILMLRGHAQMALGQVQAAIASFRDWLARDPSSVEARLRLAAALADDLQPQAAEAEVRRCLAAGERSPNAWFVLGRALLGQRRFDEAEPCFRKAVRMDSALITARTNLSELVWMRTGDPAAAAAELDVAMDGPQVPLAALLVAKARLWVAAQNPRRALAELAVGLRGAPADPVLLRAAANVALEFDGQQALAYARRALAAAPDDDATLLAFGSAALAVGAADQALATASRLRARDPDDGAAIALWADSLRMQGDPRYRTILDYGALVRAYPLDVPRPWSGLPAYLDELVRDLDTLHVLRAHPVQNSLRGGSQVLLDPARAASAAIRAFPEAVDGPLRRYIAALGSGTGPTRRRNTGRYRLNGMWSVRLRASGFHRNHYHPRGWISSACYLRVPPAVDRRGGEGWLKFGEPAFPTSPPLGAEYFLRPKPGLLALFPSYMWHGTVPFEGTGDDTRLTIAFDVVPE